MNSETALVVILIMLFLQCCYSVILHFPVLQMSTLNLVLPL